MAAQSIAVTDPLLPTNDGTYEIAPHGAKRTDAPDADIVTDIAGLSAAYLGGTTWHSLAATGRATAANPADITLADALFHSTPLPFCGTFF